MADVGTALTAALGGGGFTALWQAFKWLSEDRARRRSEQAAAQKAPLQQRSIEQRLTAGAMEIQEEAMTTLRQSNADLKAELAAARTIIRERERQISDLGTVIGRQELELQRYRPPSP